MQSGAMKAPEMCWDAYGMQPETRYLLSEATGSHTRFSHKLGQSQDQRTVKAVRDARGTAPHAVSSFRLAGAYARNSSLTITQSA